MSSTAALILGGLGAAGALGGSAISGNAAKTAAGQEVNAEQQALQFQEQVYNQQQQNQQPYLNAGATSVAQLMNGLTNGTFGPGSIPNFTPPTLQTAQQTPGYQFELQQGEKGLAEGSAAAGGAISGGTLKAADAYAQNLATTTYQQQYTNALNTYQQQLATQSQQYQQLLAPAQLGENAVANLNQTGTQAAQNVGNLMGNIGSAQAAGTVGQANALTSGISGATNSLSQAALINLLLGGGSSAYTGGPISGASLGTPAAGGPGILYGAGPG